MRHSIILATLLSASCVCSAEDLTERRMSSADIGTVVFMAPEKWVGSESYDDLEAAAVFELSTRKKRFMLRISVKYVGFDILSDAEELDKQFIARLDGYLQYAIEAYVDRSDRFEIRAARFSPKNHGIYARIADRNPEKGAYPFITHGARILGNKFITFTLNSRDADMSVLKQSLDLVTSFSAKNEWADAPDSYVCKVEQVVGFTVNEEKWEPYIAAKFKHHYIVRRTRPGDLHEDSSEWVFTGPEEEETTSYCDNEAIAHGLFICHNDADVMFRMDSKTLRFLYTYTGGYHDVPEEVVPSEESPKPQLAIGTCKAD